jgi:hypothetical protein
MLNFNIRFFPQLVNEGFHAGETFVQAGMKTPGTGKPVVSLPVV